MDDARGDGVIRLLGRMRERQGQAGPPRTPGDTARQARRGIRSPEAPPSRRVMSPPARDFEIARRRVDASVWRERLKLLQEENRQQRRFIDMDERFDRSEISRAELPLRQSAARSAAFNSIYVQCVGSTVNILNEESEHRESIRASFRAERSILDVELSSRDREEDLLAADIVRRACSAAHNEWVVGQVDEALQLVRQQRSRLFPFTVRPVLDAPEPDDDASCKEAFRRAVAALPAQSNPDPPSAQPPGAPFHSFTSTADNNAQKLATLTAPNTLTPAMHRNWSPPRRSHPGPFLSPSSLMMTHESLQSGNVEDDAMRAIHAYRSSRRL
ncbi:hypothetical protein DIPPA_12267 [Diplonema papillatum]|nr:hypothetical protein DIPPA_12267 [Diplonema papillatum]